MRARSMPGGASAFQRADTKSPPGEHRETGLSCGKSREGRLPVDKSRLAPVFPPAGNLTGSASDPARPPSGGPRNLPVGGYWQSSYFDAVSLAKSAIASCTVVMNCAGKMMVEFFS